MIALLAVLIWFYSVYMLSLVAQEPRALIVIGSLAVCYLVYFVGASQRPVLSLYGFLFITLLFPKGGNNYRLFTIQELAHVTLCAILQSIAALAICLNIVKVRKFPRRIPRELKTFGHIASLMIVVSFIVGLLRYLTGDYLTGLRVAPEELAWGVDLLQGLIFLYGCIAFIKTTEEVERIFLIIMASGIALFVECVLYFYLALPLPLANFVFHESGRFQSMFFFDIVGLSFIPLASMGFALHFAFTRKSPIWLLLIPALFVPIVPTFQRTPMVSGALIVSMWPLLYKRVPLKVSLALIGVALAAALTVVTRMDQSLGDAELLSTRPDYLQSDSYTRSWISRLGAQARGIDVIFHSMPFGVGPWRMPIVMGSNEAPQYMSGLVPREEAESFYSLIASGEHETGPHNFFIAFVGEYGLLGAVFILLFINVCNRCFRPLPPSGAIRSVKQLTLIAAQTSSYCVLLGLSLMGMFYNSLPYWLTFFLLFLIVFASKERPRATESVGGARAAGAEFGEVAKQQTRLVRCSATRSRVRACGTRDLWSASRCSPS